MVEEAIGRVGKTVKFRTIFKLGPKVIADVMGHRAIETDTLSIEELQRVPEVEAFLERLTGFRVHIETLHEVVLRESSTE